MESCEEDDELIFDVDSDEEVVEVDQIGEKCISLLASLLPTNSSPKSNELITTALSLEFELKSGKENVNEEDEEEEEENFLKIMETYDYPDPYPVQIRARPEVPPKPPIDTVRFSMNNMKESADWQLDELLEELEALETQLNTSNGGDQLLLGVSGLPASVSQQQKISTTTTTTSLPPLPPPAPKSVMMMSTNSAASQSSHQLSSTTTTTTTILASACSSPDGDSAFGDSSSTESNRCRNSAFSSSNDSCRDSLNTPSPTQVSPRNGDVNAAEEAKALKIRQALEKMKEAKVTKIFVKFFVEDGQPLQMLIDERWTVADTMKQLAEKNHISLMEDHCIVEEYPELYIKRIYEDHEKVVENIQMWVQDSPNKLYFMRRPDKFNFFDRPELYLITEKTSDHIEVPQGVDQWTIDVKQQFVRDYFSRDPVVPPEMEGFLYLKSDGRKSWKKHFFVLRPSGLYYSAKGKKSTTKDLQCLMNLHSNQVYTGINWEKKYKSPTPWCISIKLTALQIKRSQFIKYICAEDEMTFKKWIVALRIAKNGSDLLNNFDRACQIRRETLGVATSSMSAASSSTAISSESIVLNGHHRSPSIASYAMSNSGAVGGMSTRPLSVNVRNHSPASFSVTSSQPSQPSPSRVAEKLVEHPQYDEQPTGTIKRAPIDVLRRVSRTSTSCSSPTTIPQEESDSDEEFPAPPPPAAIQRQATTTTTPTPTTTTTPATPIGMKKAPPPPPPKRAEATRLQTTPQKHMSDLEAALARRREKMAEMS